MGGIYIPGMKHPQNCFSCDFGKFFSDGGPYCDRLKRAVMSGLQRPDWCPIVPAPDHGRLGDLDALCDKYGDWYTEEGTEVGFIGALKYLLYDAPTIIPADKEARDDGA